MKNELSGLSIEYVSQVVGLTPLVLRAWERRYGVVVPKRRGNRRIYSSHDLERLKKLKLLVELGISIKKASQMSEEEISTKIPQIHDSLVQKRQEIIRLLKVYDLEGINSALRTHRIRRGVKDFLMGVVCPLMAEVGKMVELGRLNVSQEHAISALVNDQIAKIRIPQSDRKLPRLVFCTPEGDLHSIGILVASRLAQTMRFPIYFLGCNLPAASLFDTLKALDVKIVVIGTSSIPSNLDHLETYLKEAGLSGKGSPETWIAGALAEKFKTKYKTFHAMEDFFKVLEELSAK